MMIINNISKKSLIKELHRKYNVAPNTSSSIITISSRIETFRNISSSSESKSTITTVSSPPQSGSLYLQFLKDPSIDSHTTHHSKSLPLYKRSFKDINSSDFVKINVSEFDHKNLSWSSENDKVTRAPFAKDITHLQSLLDALISSRNFDRADNILKALYPLLINSENFLFCLNKYLEAWSLEDGINYQELENYIVNLQNYFQTEDFKPNFKNDRTYALLISKNFESRNFVKDSYIDILKHNPSLSKRVLNHIDVVGMDALISIFENPAITSSHIPTDLLDLFHKTEKKLNDENAGIDADLLESEKVPDYFRKNQSAPSIEKDVDTLMSVDSFGLKVIRHTLLGLQAHQTTTTLNSFVDDLEVELDKHVLHDNSNINKKDYFKIKNSLKTDEDRIKFNEILDEFNVERQKSLETKGVDAAREKWRHEFEEMSKRGGLAIDKNINAQLYKWYQDLLPYIKEEARICQDLIDNKIDEKSLSGNELEDMKNRNSYAPYFVLVPPTKMCVITLLELIRLSVGSGAAEGMRVAKAVISLGKAIEIEYRSQDLIKNEGKAISKKTRSAVEWKKLIRTRDYKNKDPTSNNEWESQTHSRIGSVLTSLVLDVVEIPVTGIDPTTGQKVKATQPAFQHTYQFMQGQRIGLLKVHKELVKKLGGKSMSNSVQPQLLPMLTPPRPWTKYNVGGYLYSHNMLVRSRDSHETQAYLRAASENGNLDKVYDGLNVLGQTPWTVNQKIFSVISHYWNTGKPFYDIAPIQDEIKFPSPLPSNADPADKHKYQLTMKKLIQESSSAKSQRCDTNYKLEIARAFLGEKIYFPHNIDFRGRAYPLSPHFNHLGSDLTRSLFIFWEGKEVGERGLEWLKVHLSNVFGVDKLPLRDRVKFIDENLENVFDSAKNPIGDNKWWMKAEKPWQTLTVCFELYEAYKLDDPTKHISFMPVHQDGTCNGLQHYAALGGDVEGARQVNLMPSDRPQDVYSHVASLVQERVNKDCENGHEIAKFLSDKINRKVVKQTVMTNVYGVTYVGAVQQIGKQLKVYFDGNEDESLQVHKVAQYLAIHVLGSVRELFEGAHLLQDWLGECAKRIGKSVRNDVDDDSSSSFNKPSHLSSVIWTTPLGLPCVQPYRISKKQLIQTNLQDITITDPFGISQVDARKQQAGFTPNFVHSLDATHMLLTSKACGEKGIAFASVHDSYWTHACDVDTMNKEIRNQFVYLHENNLIVKLKDEFEKRYKGSLQVLKIPTSHEVVKKIKEVKKKIAKDIDRAITVADEIELERVRQSLLSSPDLKLVQQGKEMETTVSVTEGYDLHKHSTTKVSGVTTILVPLTFPEIPSRGDFDVKQVKESQYFFS